MEAGDAACDGEAESVSLSGWVEAHEAFEDALPLRVGDAGTVVRDTHADVFPCAPDADVHRTGRMRHGGQRVVQQVAQQAA